MMRKKSHQNFCVIRKTRGTYLVSIPRALAEILALEGAWLEWRPSGKDRLIANIHRRDPSS
ncbi:MAG: hypothetical protein ACOY58_07755 [Candidatus Micrarchaeota archaeon]